MGEEEGKLNLNQERFCQIYTDLDKELFGNGVQSYVEAYNIDTNKKGWYNSAVVSASRLLTNDKIVKRINELLVKQGFNDENVERQHLFLLNQHADLKTKMKAVDSYYKLTGKNAPDKVLLETIEMSDEQAARLLKRKE